METVLLPQWAETLESPFHLFCPDCQRTAHPSPHIYKAIEECLKNNIEIWCYGLPLCDGSMKLNARMDARRWGVEMKGKRNVVSIAERRGKRPIPKGGKL